MPIDKITRVRYKGMHSKRSNSNQKYHDNKQESYLLKFDYSPRLRCRKNINEHGAP